MPALPRFSAIAAVLFIALGLAACSPSGGLAPGLVARVDATGARLDTAVALGLVNDLRRSRGVPVLARDAALEQKAQEAANTYARTGKSPNRPDGAARILTSAGYLTFAETFSGWRGSGTDTDALADPGMRRAGLAVTWDGNAEFGSYWVLLLAE